MWWFSDPIRSIPDMVQSGLLTDLAPTVRDVPYCWYRNPMAIRMWLVDCNGGTLNVNVEVQ